MKVSDIYETFLRASDLQKPVQVQISEVTVKTFKDQKSGDEQRKIVLSFEHARKAMVLNKTQARAVAAAVGTDEIEHWPGRTLVLSAGTAPTGQSTVLVSPVVTAPAAGGNPFPAGGDDGKDKDL